MTCSKVNNLTLIPFPDFQIQMFGEYRSSLFSSFNKPDISFGWNLCSRFNFKKARTEKAGFSVNTNMKYELKSEYMCAKIRWHMSHAVKSKMCMRISVSDTGAFNNSEQSWGHI